MMKTTTALLIAAAAAALSSGCTQVKIRVVGDRPADVLLTQDLPANRGDPKYIGRVDSGSASRPSTEAAASSMPYAFEYTVPDPLHSYGLVVVVRTKDGDWMYPVDPAFVGGGETITIRYPPADATAPAARVPPVPVAASVPTSVPKKTD
jgi:hypothetical protein